MERKQARQKTHEMLLEAVVFMQKKIDYALDCGAINFEQYDDGYALPRIILCTILKEATCCYYPINKVYQEEIENLYQCI